MKHCGSDDCNVCFFLVFLSFILFVLLFWDNVLKIVTRTGRK